MKKVKRAKHARKPLPTLATATGPVGIVFAVSLLTIFLQAPGAALANEYSSTGASETQSSPTNGSGSYGIGEDGNTATSESAVDNGSGSSQGQAKVAVGGGNLTVQYYKFSPQRVEINAGESVTWYSPIEMNEIHTVTFVLDPSLQSDIILPFSVAESTSFTLLPPFNIGEPQLMPGPNGTNVIAALNKLAFNPAVVDSQRNITYLNGSDVSYTLEGDEKALNSGIIMSAQTAESPEGQGIVNSNGTAGSSMPEGNETSMPAGDTGPGNLPFPAVNSFTVTFERPRTYDYFCAIHPWMTGQVVVK